MTARQRGSKALITLALLVVIAFYLFPLLVMLSTSLKQTGQVMSKTWQWIPRTLTLEQYTRVLKQYPFGRWLLNSVIITVGTVMITLGVSLPAGYAFARIHFRGKGLLFGLCLLTIMIPLCTYVPQLYLQMFYFKLTNTFFALMIPLCTSAVSLFLFRQFISQIPLELEDAAQIDGCGRWGVFFRVILTLTRPAIVTALIFTAIKSWNSLLWPLIAASKDNVKPLPVGLAVNVFLVTTGIMHQPPYGVVMASSFLSIILPVALFIALQRYFVQGVATTGLK
jgi:ABC-type glycerol-3-phosphate transport system permease component